MLFIVGFFAFSIALLVRITAISIHDNLVFHIYLSSLPEIRFKFNQGILWLD